MKDIKRVKIKRLKKTTQLPEASNTPPFEFILDYCRLTI